MKHFQTFLVLAMTLLCGSLYAQNETRQNRAAQDDPEVTPVSGESWLKHLHRSFDETSMGKTGRLGPAPQQAGAFTLVSQQPGYSFRQRGFLRGADLYRLNCQSCHGESGQGAPPEINSVINPVRATSVPLVIARMKNADMEISHSDAAKLAQQSKTALLDRLHKGGENMPSFAHLHEAEIASLLSYLNYLAGVPGATNNQAVIVESPLRIGEFIVKSTCHTCHSAVGPDPNPQQMMDGAIPPLSALTSRKTQSEFVRKVAQGAPVVMGAPPALFRGRMPVFYYLSEEEADDVYAYLLLYPPADRPPDHPLVLASLSETPPPSPGPGSPIPLLAARNVAPNDPDSTRTAQIEFIAVPLVVMVTITMLAGGLYFTFREFGRLCAKGAGRIETSRSIGAAPSPSSRTKGILQSLPPLQYDSVKRSLP